MEFKKIKQLREEIDLLDTTLVTLLDRRADIALEIGKIKLENNLTITDNSREKIVLEKTNCAKNSESIKEIFIKIIAESKKLQEHQNVR